MGTVRGGYVSAAKRLGMSLGAYLAHVAAGERRCWDCQAWKDRTQFYSRNTRYISSRCIDCSRVYMRIYMRTYKRSEEAAS